MGSRLVSLVLSALVVATPGMSYADGPAAAPPPSAAPVGAPDAPLTPAPADSGGPEEALTQKIGVWRFDALGIDPELVARLETLFRMELDRLAKSPLPSRRDIDRAITGDLRECTGEAKCLAAIGKKLGVDVMVAGSVGALGSNYVLNIKAVDVATATQIRRITTDPLRGSPDELIEAVRVAAYRLLAPEQIHGSIAVLTDLIGAQVLLDGKPVGKTPIAAPIAKQPLGKHQLRVEAAGYAPFDEPVEVHFQKSSRVVVRLIESNAVAGSMAPIYVEKHPIYQRTWFLVAASAAAILIGLTIGKCAGDSRDAIGRGNYLCSPH